MSTGVPFFIVRHVFDRVDLRDNTLVTVTTCHLITRLWIHLADRPPRDLGASARNRRRVILTAPVFLELVFQLVILSASCFS